MRERTTYNVRDVEENADREMKEKCLEANGEHDAAEKKREDSVDRERVTFSERAKKLGTNKICLILVLLCVLLVVFFIIIIALAVRVGTLERRTGPVQCSTSQCLGASSKIVSNWNTTYDPCHDFWNFSCGEWFRSHPLPDNRGSLGVVDLLQEKVYRDLRHLLDLVPYKATVRDPDWKAQRFYHSCMNVEDVEQTKHTFKNKLNEIGGWTLLSSWSSQRWDRNTVIRRLHDEFGVTPFFKFVVEPDDNSPNENIIKILPAGLGLPSPSYYFLSPNNKYETIYKAYMDDVARQLGGSNTNQFASNTFNFEKRLAEVTPTPEDLREPFTHYKKVTIQQLSTMAPTISWEELLQKVFPNANINRMTEVAIFSKAYFEQLSNILSSTDNLALHNYLMWQFTFTYAPHLSANFREISNRFYQALEGVPNTALKSAERWEYCLKVTSEYLGHALGAMYVKNYFVPDSAEQALGVETEIQNAFSNYLNSISWAEDSNTRQLIKAKMDSLLAIRGYPEFILNAQALSDYYNELFVQVDFLENIKNGKYFLKKKKEARLLSQVTMDESWSISPQDVQPVYHYYGNQLVIPAGLLQEPLFNPGLPLSVRFGQLGTHIASQMFKALDEKGISYEKKGTLDPWLSGKSALRYQHKEECLKNRLSESEEISLDNANLTVGEFIADIAAVKFAYQAYRNLEREYDLPGIGRNHDQVFFISYAQSMCEHIRPEKVDIWAGASTSSPRHKRVLNTLKELSEFSDAFSCPAGSEMNPGKSCHMW